MHSRSTYKTLNQILNPFMENKKNPDTPQIFISYSWSSDHHIEKVVSLATRLRQNGVDVN